MKTNKLVLTALLTAFALAAFAIEAAFPPVTPIYGIKLGIANVFTLFALYALGPFEAAAVLFIRIILGNIITGQFVSFIYSLAGGVLSFAVMLLLKRFFDVKRLWVLSAICAVAHNFGQLAAAIAVTGTPELLYYLPVLIISGIIAGSLTGLCAQIVLLRITKIKTPFTGDK